MSQSLALIAARTVEGDFLILRCSTRRWWRRSVHSQSLPGTTVSDNGIFASAYTSEGQHPQRKQEPDWVASSCMSGDNKFSPPRKIHKLKITASILTEFRNGMSRDHFRAVLDVMLLEPRQYIVFGDFSNERLIEKNNLIKSRWASYHHITHTLPDLIYINDKHNMIKAKRINNQSVCSLSWE